jgi:hypothetical protein
MGEEKSQLYQKARIEIENSKNIKALKALMS